MRYFLVTAIFFSLNLSCSSQNIEQEKTELLSAIELPEDLYPIESLEEWYPNGDGYFLARYELEGAIFESAKSQIKKVEKINNLPFGDEIIDDLIFDYVEEDDNGYYLLNYNRNDPRDIKMIVLNETKNELIFLISYQ
ncbi:MAG: hypothetical protein ACFB2Y_23655 [Fulvivirga sp.]